MASLSDTVFSRAGQNSKDKYHVLKQLKQVLYRRSHSQDFHPKRKDPHRVSTTVLEDILTLQTQDTTEDTSEQKSEEKSFIFAVQSRDDYYAAHVKGM